MKKHLCLLATTLILVPATARTDSSIIDPDRYSWIANAGWMDWRPDAENGVAFQYTYASGYAYSANLGWISFGDGTPGSNGSYGNSSGDDFGVNVDGNSDADFLLLSGYAYSANAGWISFNITDPELRPRINKDTGVLEGYAYGANIGWLPLTSSEYTVTTILPVGLEGFVVF